MGLRLVQLMSTSGARQLVAYYEVSEARQVIGFDRMYDLVQAALRAGARLDDFVTNLLGGPVDVRLAEAEGRLLVPIDHPDPAHLYVSGTGLTHLGSAEGRDKMHRSAAGDDVTDSMRMFMLGVKGGKPLDGEVGAQPEWFYKGDGSILVGTGQPLVSPFFAFDGSEEPEIAGIYIIDDAGDPRRIGFTLGNEFSDHVTERGNYLWLAHSKLRQAALGAEILTGELPSDVQGVSSIDRASGKLWEKPFLSGEANMSHSIANLEYHHFKYDIFRRPGDIHVHFLGTATLSFSDGVKVEAGDVFRVEAAPFQIALSNPLRHAPDGAAFRPIPL